MAYVVDIKDHLPLKVKEGHRHQLLPKGVTRGEKWFLLRLEIYEPPFLSLKLLLQVTLIHKLKRKKLYLVILF